MPDRSELNVDDVIVSKVQDGHLLLIVTADPRDRLSLVYRGNDWYLDTLRRDPPSGVAIHSVLRGR